MTGARILTEADPRFDIEVPVAIIGAGAAGLVAALACREAGVEPLVLERDAVPRGSTSLSAGLIPAAGTRFQRAHGIVDDAATFAEDIRRKAHGQAEPTLVRIVAQAAGPAIEWLADRFGLPFSVVHDFDYPGHSHRRMHGLPGRSGAELVDRLRAAAEASDVPMLTEARVTTRIVDAAGALRGLVAERPDGSAERIGARAIVLGCSGYAGNKALVRRYIPDLADAVYFGHPGNEGEAPAWGEQLHAELRDMTGHQGHGSVAHPQGILVSWAVIMEGGFQVNLYGQRFWNEGSGYSEAGVAVMGQPDHVAWQIWDTRCEEIAIQMHSHGEAQKAGAIKVCNTVENIARMVGCDSATLAQTIGEVADIVRGKSADPFGRDFGDKPVLEAPYNVCKIMGALFHTQGGLEVNKEGRVLRTNGTPFPNLFAGGGAARGLSGPSDWGYLSGSGLLMATNLGRLSGEAAAAMVKK